MPVADDDYRRRLAKIKLHKSRETSYSKPNVLPETVKPSYPLIPALAGDEPVKQAEWQNRFNYASLSPNFNAFKWQNKNPNPALETAVLGSIGGGLPNLERAGAGLLSQLPWNIVRYGIDQASAAGRKNARDLIRMGAAGGLEPGSSRQAYIDNGSAAGEEALFRMFDTFARIGVKPQTAVKFLENFPDAMIKAFNRDDMLPSEIKKMTTQERLASRLLDQIDLITEDTWWKKGLGGG